MRKKFMRDHLIFRMRCHFAEAASDDHAGESGGGGSEDQFDAKTAIAGLQSTITTLQKDLSSTKKLTGEVSGIKAMIAKLDASLAALKPGDKDDEDDAEDDAEDEEEETPPARAKKAPAKTKAKEPEKDNSASEQALADLKKQMRELQVQLKRATDETAAERAARIAAETKQQHLERDRGILEAANPILSSDVTAKEVIRYFKDDLEFDKDADAWMYVDGEDRLPLADAVKKFLPKYMQKPKTVKGGSGGETPNGTGQNGPSKVTLKQNALDAHANAQKNPRLVPAYNRARKAYIDAGGDPAELVDAVAVG
jgi:hypothetical protein